MKSAWRDCRGSVMMETVLVLPVLLLLVFGILQFAHIWIARQMTAYAAFCATRAIMVVPPTPEGSSDEQTIAAQQAAEVAISWMHLVDGGQNPIQVPGWGGVAGSGHTSEGKSRITATVRARGQTEPYVAVTVAFKFPLVISGMAVNKILANAIQAIAPSANADFYSDLNAAAGHPDEIDGWPFVELKETCVLPMPYSTARFPRGAFSGVNVRGR